MQEHLDGVRVAYWTAKHKPVKIKLEEDLGVVTVEHAKKRENQVTRDLMKQYGLNNVRGGDLTSTEDYVQRFGYIRFKQDWYDGMWGLAAAILLFGFIIYFIFREGLIQL